MNRDMERYKQFSRRAVVLGIGQVSLFALLAGRLGYLQIVQNEKYQTLSDKNRISLRLLPADRGEITDRFGVPLAINTANFRVFLIPEQTEDVGETLSRLSRIIPLSEVEKESVLVEIERNRRFTPVLVKENLSWDDMARIEINLPDLPGISVDEGKSRQYPLGKATAHVLGYVGLVSKSELTDDPIMSLPGYRIGKTGIEKAYDQELRGRAGNIQVEVNAVGREVREIDRQEGQDGKRLTLTLDAELQLKCQERLAQEKSATAVVMDAYTGEVYALASHPAFDPNIFSSGISAEYWEELLANEANPLTNKAISGQYPPGSTFKMVTALAALENGIKADHTVYCPGYYEVGTDRFHCWKHSGHGHVGYTSAMEQSCDVFFYEIAQKIGIVEIAKMARRLGLGEELEIEIPGEAPGLIPDKDWKRGRFGKPWYVGETVVAGIGQGYILTTPLQLVTMTARLVNGGLAVFPKLVRAIQGEGFQIPEWSVLNIPKSHIAIVKRGMDAVVNNKKGTANSSKIEEDPYSMGGKTGTAQVRRITAQMRAQGIENEDLAWKYRHHALFVGYGPVTNPRYVCAVVVEHGGGGSSVAAPLARDLLLMVQKRDPAKQEDN